MKPQCKKPCQQHIYNSQWYQHLPPQMHQLIIPEPWQGPSDPHEYKDEEEDLPKKYNCPKNR